LLYDFGEKALKFYFVLTGWVRVESKNLCLGEFGPGTIIGEEWLYSKNYRTRVFRAYCPESNSPFVSFREN